MQPLTSPSLAALLLLILIPVAVVAFAFKSKKKMSLVVKWGRERLLLPLPPQDATLAVLRHAIAELTSLPPHSFKLIHAGALMKDDNAPISAYGLRAQSTIALIGGGDQHPPASSQSAKHRERLTEQSTIAQIKSELLTIRDTLLPSLDSFLASISPDAAPAPPHSTDPAHAKADLEHEHARIGELLLQALLRLDVIPLEGEWQDARRERKVAVKEVQGLLDRLDGGWRARLKS